MLKKDMQCSISGCHNKVGEHGARGLCASHALVVCYCPDAEMRARRSYPNIPVYKGRYGLSSLLIALQQAKITGSILEYLRGLMQIKRFAYYLEWDDKGNLIKQENLL